MPMTEPDVTLTDYALALECLILCGLVLRAEGRLSSLGGWLATFFAAGAAASLFGGTVHGFFLAEGTLAHAILWRMTLIAVAVATLSLWAIGASLLRSPRVTRWIVVAAVAQCVAYTVAAVFLTQAFEFAMLCHVPAVLFVLLCLERAYRRTKRTAFAVAAGGVAVMLVAGALQQMSIELHPVYFTHNALYHVVQMFALGVFYAGARPLAREGGLREPVDPRPADVMLDSTSGAPHVDTP